MDLEIITEIAKSSLIILSAIPASYLILNATEFFAIIGTAKRINGDSKKVKEYLDEVAKNRIYGSHFLESTLTSLAAPGRYLANRHIDRNH